MYKYFFVIFSIIAVSGCQQRQDTWQMDSCSQWRGEGRDGVYHETGLLKSWNEDGPELLWVFEGLGEGWSSVAVADQKIYVNGMLEPDNLHVFVLDLNGNLLNKKHLGKEIVDNRFPGVRSTITVNDGKLYVYNGLGNLWCLDQTSLDIIWTKDMTKDFDGRNVTWGLVESPLIVGDKIFMTPGGEKNNMVALNKKTGALIWSSTGTGRASSYCSPQFISGYAVPMIVTYLQGVRGEGRNSTNEIAAFNANNGELIWTHPHTSGNTINPNTPLYFDGKIFVTTGYGGGALLLRLTDNGKAVEQIWHNTEMDNQMGGAVKVGDYVYGSGQNNNNWFCIDLKTGEAKYRIQEIGRSNTIFADGLLYVYSERGRMFLVKPNPNEPEIISSFEIAYGANQHWAHPVIDDGIMYVRRDDALMAYKIKD